MKNLSFVEYYRFGLVFYKVTNSRIFESVNAVVPAVKKQVFTEWQSVCGYDDSTVDEYESIRAEALSRLGLCDESAKHSAMIAAFEEQETNRYVFLPF